MAREQELWRKLVTDGLAYDGKLNSRLDFGGMSRRYGKAWVDYIHAAWECRDADTMDEMEFSRLNGGIPPGYLDRLRQLS